MALVLVAVSETKAAAGLNSFKKTEKRKANDGVRRLVQKEHAQPQASFRAKCLGQCKVLPFSRTHASSDFV